MPRVKLTNRYLLTIGDEEIVFDHSKTLIAEAVEAERITQLTWPQILVGLDNRMAVAAQVVVYLMRKRSNPKLRINDVVFSMGELEVSDPDKNPNHWVVVADDFGVEGLDVLDLDDEGNRINRLQDTVDDEDPKAESLHEATEA